MFKMEIVEKWGTSCRLLFGNVFSMNLSQTWVLDLGYAHLKSSLKISSRMFDRPSKIFVREHTIYGPQTKILGGWTNMLDQSSETSPLFFDNLPFEHFDNSVNHESRLTLWSKCSKWRLSKNRGLVADGCLGSIKSLYYTFGHWKRPFSKV